LRIAQRTDQIALHQHAEQGDQQHRERGCDEQREMQEASEDVGRIGAERIERAMGQVEDPGDAEDQRKADRQHGVDRARDGAVNQDFKHTAPMQ
jgi:hypothetical protein